MTELWIASDELLISDGIARAKVEYPYEPHDLEAVGLLMDEPAHDDAVEAAAAVEDFDDVEIGDDV